MKTKSSTRASQTAGSGPFVATLDVGSSSVRTMLFDAHGREVEGLGVQLAYTLSTPPGGGAEVDARKLADLAVRALTTLHGHMEERGLRAAAVACCTFWHNVLGVGTDNEPVTPVLHPFDTRAAAAARELAKRIDERALHARTGCVLHASYLPAKLLWLSETEPRVFRSARQWMSFGEFLLLKLFGKASASVGMVSGSGLWNQNENDYDTGVFSVLPVEQSQFAPIGEMDEPLSGLRGECRASLPGFTAIPWFPAWGDGACSNIGTGCNSPERFALMVGTSGALRAVTDAPRIKIPSDLWCYRVDRKRFVMGGALSNGGEVYAWMRRVLVLPSDDQIESQLQKLEPGAHGLTVLPLFAGERSPHWRAEARGAITGLSASTQPIEIVRAALESVALRFRILFDLLKAKFGSPQHVIASGGGLLRSPAWTQMMADALGHPVTTCIEAEGSSRGAALLAFERLGIIERARELPCRTDRVFTPVPAHIRIYEDQLRQQENLYKKLFET